MGYKMVVLTPATANLRLAETVFKNSADTESTNYYKGQKYVGPGNWVSRFFYGFSLEERLETLHRFYPHQTMIKNTYEEFQEEQQAGFVNGLYATGFLWFSIYNMARR